MLGVLTVAVTFLYVYFNREVIIAKVSAVINQSISGELVTGKINIDFLHYFPATAIHISDVAVRDSLFSTHKMDFFRASDVFVKINFLELFEPEPSLENLTFHNGSVYIFSDSSGYSNNYLLKSRAPEQGGAFKMELREINLENFRFIFNDHSPRRYHNVLFNSLKCLLHADEKKISLAVKTDGVIKMLAFNLDKGTYARDAGFNNNIVIYYDAQNKIIDIPEHSFYLDNQLIIARAVFHLGNKPYFNADLKAPRILFADALKFMPEKTERALLKYEVKRPLQIHVRIEGQVLPGSPPYVYATLKTAANTLTYKAYTFSNCRLQAFYTNRADSSQKISPSNSAFEINNFSGYWLGIPVKSEKVRFDDFPFPVMKATIYGAFPLYDLKKLPGGALYNFYKGTGNYRADITSESDSTAWRYDIGLHVNIKDAALIYEPRSIAFEDVNAGIYIKNNDVFIEHASCRSGSSLFSLKGQAPGILNTNISDLTNSSLKWEIKSPYINLADFTPFLGSRKKGIEETKPVADKSNFGKHLDRYLDACRLNMKLDIDALRFDKFTATALSGTVLFNDSTWSLEKIRFNHADGTVNLAGKLSPVSDDVQAVSIQTTLKDVNISEVFTAFDNFSQHTISSNQINGTLDAEVTLGFNMNNKASISQSSISGLVDLTVSNGELKGFQPMGKFSRFLFRKRDFSDIRFSEITNSFIARGNEIYFDRMKINTSVMELYLEGSYFLDGKTDMRLQVPLSNLKSRDWSEISDNITDKGDKGMNVYIQASTDENGDLKFRYDPLKKLKDKRSRR